MIEKGVAAHVQTVVIEDSFDRDAHRGPLTLKCGCNTVFIQLKHAKQLVSHVTIHQIQICDSYGL